MTVTIIVGAGRVRTRHRGVRRILADRAGLQRHRSARRDRRSRTTTTSLWRSARPSRRPFGLPRLFRLRHVGLPAGEFQRDLKQIEVIRGPASAVWGANAMTGVVNVITKSPRELAAERRHVADDRLRRLRPQRPGRGPRHRLAVLRQRLARAGGERPLGLQAVGRLLHPGSAAAAGRHHPTTALQHPVSPVYQHRHVAAEVRRARGLRHAERRP